MSALHTSLYISAVSWITAQTLKAIVGLIREGRLDMHLLVRPGGMPSSHSALVTGLATSVGIIEGFNSVGFAISVVFASIVMYDAAGVRLSVSRQSVILNRILQELWEFRPKDIPRDVRQLIGHTPFQVFAGAMLGICVAVMWLYLCGDINWFQSQMDTPTLSSIFFMSNL
ncbi:MAG: divergent PAP2 family protein [Dehalococcoidia bacterium]|nr:divergent PAP2 family protein [Dehalococcoidia bacterium]